MAINPKERTLSGPVLKLQTSDTLTKRSHQMIQSLGCSPPTYDLSEESRPSWYLTTWTKENPILR